MELLLNDRVWVEECVGFREEVGWIGGLSTSNVGVSHAACKEVLFWCWYDCSCVVYWCGSGSGNAVLTLAGACEWASGGSVGNS